MPTSSAQRLTYWIVAVLFVGCIICGAFLNRIRGGWIPLPEWLPDNDWTHDGYGRLVMASGTGLVAGIGVSLRRPAWQSVLATVLVTGVTYFAYFVGWGSYFSMGHYIYAPGTIRVGIFDVVVGYPEDGWSFHRQMLRDLVGMSLRGLVQSVPVGMILLFFGGGWVGVWAGVMMGPLYILGYALGNPDPLSPWAQGTASGEVYWGVWSFLITLWPLFAAAARGCVTWSPSPEDEEMEAADLSHAAARAFEIEPSTPCLSCKISGAAILLEEETASGGRGGSGIGIGGVGGGSGLSGCFALPPTNTPTPSHSTTTTHSNSHSQYAIGSDPSLGGEEEYGGGMFGGGGHEGGWEVGKEVEGEGLCCVGWGRVGCCGCGVKCGCLPAQDHPTDSLPAFYATPAWMQLASIHIPLFLLELMWIVCMLSYAEVHQEDRRNMQQTLNGMAIVTFTTLFCHFFYAYYSYQIQHNQHLLNLTKRQRASSNPTPPPYHHHTIQMDTGRSDGSGGGDGDEPLLYDTSLTHASPSSPHHSTSHHPLYYDDEPAPPPPQTFPPFPVLWTTFLQLPPSSTPAIPSFHSILLSIIAVSTVAWCITTLVLLIIVAVQNPHAWGTWPGARFY